VIWANPEPTTLPDGTKRFPQEGEASLFQMHNHLIMEHDHPPFPEGALTPKEMLQRHADAHRTPSGYTHDPTR
jgi:hypothetical protein